MSTPKVANWPARSPWILPNGCVTPEVSRWLETVVTAALNSQASSASGLQDQINALQASEMTLQSAQASIRDFPDVLQTGGGGVDLADILQPGAGAVMSDTTWQVNPSI